MARVIVYHGGYGCNTGCCGHYLEFDTPLRAGHFEFTHFDGDDGERIEWAKQMIKDAFGEEHVKDLDWENSVIVSYNECSF